MDWTEGRLGLTPDNAYYCLPNDYINLPVNSQFERARPRRTNSSLG